MKNNASYEKVLQILDDELRVTREHERYFDDSEVALISMLPESLRDKLYWALRGAALVCFGNRLKKEIES